MLLTRKRLYKTLEGEGDSHTEGLGMAWRIARALKRSGALKQGDEQYVVYAGDGERKGGDQLTPDQQELLEQHGIKTE